MLYANAFAPRLLAELAREFPINTNESREGWTPAVDLTTTDEAYILTADLPGIRYDDLDLSVEQGILTLKGERAAPEDGERTRAERRFGAFKRSFSLPENADTDNISAKYENGVLTVTVPKQAKPQARKIEVVQH
ncbi:MAG TPA: Hsp20/alpha crystallin family protein [Gammaproteobacteria bacterium]|nr:Hsp20/alpha crystallin family protein [Gammaproteobacteria bacterium]